VAADSRDAIGCVRDHLPIFFEHFRLQTRNMSRLLHNKVYYETATEELKARMHKKMSCVLWEYRSYPVGVTIVCSTHEPFFAQYNEYKAADLMLKASYDVAWINKELEAYNKNHPEQIQCPMPLHGLAYSPRVLHCTMAGRSKYNLADGCLIIDRPYGLPFLVPIQAECRSLLGVLNGKAAILVGGEDTVFIKSDASLHEITLSTGESRVAEKYWWSAHHHIVMRPGSTNEVYASKGWNIMIGKIRAFEPARIMDIKAAVLPFMENESEYKQRLTYAIEEDMKSATSSPVYNPAWHVLTNWVKEKGVECFYVALQGGNLHSNDAVFFRVTVRCHIQPKGTGRLFSVNLSTGNVTTYTTIRTTGILKYYYCSGRLLTCDHTGPMRLAYKHSPPPELIEDISDSGKDAKGMLAASNEFLLNANAEFSDMDTKIMANTIYSSQVRTFLPPTRAEIEMMTRWLMANSGGDEVLPIVVWRLIAVMLSDV
jgi:hypothetical protein